MISWLSPLANLISDWVAYALIVISVCYIGSCVVRAAVTNPHKILRAVCGELALLFAILAVLWAVVVGERHGVF